MLNPLLEPYFWWHRQWRMRDSDRYGQSTRRMKQPVHWTDAFLDVQPHWSDSGTIGDSLSECADLAGRVAATRFSDRQILADAVQAKHTF